MDFALSGRSVIERLSEWIDLTLGTLLGAECAVCGTPLMMGAVCDPCRELCVLVPPFCRQCGYPLAEAMEECGECLLGKKPSLDGVASLFWFDDKARALWGKIKFHQRRELLRPLRKMISTSLDGQIAVPVPLSFSRFTTRWINHSEWLADLVAKGNRCDALIKAIDSSPQSLVGGALRNRNVHGAFAIARGVHVPDNVILIDDIYTTGATLNECARVLKKAGAGRVTAWTLFRTPHWK